MMFGESGIMPDTLKFLLAIGLVAGAFYGAVLALASFPPEPTEISKPLPHDKLRQH